MPTTTSPPTHRRQRTRTSTLNIPKCDKTAYLLGTSDCSCTTGDIEYKEDECKITKERLKMYQALLCEREANNNRRASCILTSDERKHLQKEQIAIRKTLNLPALHHVGSAATATGGVASAVGSTSVSAASLFGIKSSSIPEEEDGPLKHVGKKISKVGNKINYLLGLRVAEEEEEKEVKQDNAARPKFIPPPQDSKSGQSLPDIKESLLGSDTIKFQMMKAKLRARLDTRNDGVLGVQQSDEYCVRGAHPRHDSFRDPNSKFIMYNMKRASMIGGDLGIVDSLDAEDLEGDDGEEEVKEMDVEDISYVRKPRLVNIIQEYQALQNHPKYNLKQIVLSRRFHLYAHRYANAQFQRTLVYPTLKQPDELYSCAWLKSQTLCGECKEAEEVKPVTEKQPTRINGHRFIIAADTQFGILMDGFAMDFPNWNTEIDISRKCVAQINAMKGNERPLFVCVCGDLVDTESSFSGAIASWKKVMSGWERNLVFEQQVRDFKRVWAGLHPDIALVCLCGNHDVGNRPTKESIKHWTSSFGDEYLSFWVNGTFNICLNNCLFSNPTGAQEMFEEQLQWMEEKLIYARENDATHIFVYGHFPWFLKHEDEADDEITSYSKAPKGWGPPGSSFEDNYFTIPYEQRKIAMAMFKKYDVTACFSGHFHQNVVTKVSFHCCLSAHIIGILM